MDGISSTFNDVETGADVSSAPGDKQIVLVGGLPIAVMDRRATAAYTVSAALSRRSLDMPCLMHTTANGQVISYCASRPAVRDLYRKADLISPDGMSIVFASRLLCPVPLPERVATTDAFHDVASLAAARGASFYFLGGSASIVERAAERVEASYPGLRIAGWHDGYFPAERDGEVAARIDAAAPDILWVGMGVPRQQEFILTQRERMTHVGVAKTCGGLFDFLAGKNSRAPMWMQAVGLEWLYRSWLEPKRLGWRYLTTNPHAVYVMLRDSGGKMAN